VHIKTLAPRGHLASYRKVLSGSYEARSSFHTLARPHLISAVLSWLQEIWKLECFAPVEVDSIELRSPLAVETVLRHKRNAVSSMAPAAHWSVEHFPIRFDPRINHLTTQQTSPP
jgi:hypothetical protein